MLRSGLSPVSLAVKAQTLIKQVSLEIQPATP
jgi:hypothetical protein